MDASKIEQNTISAKKNLLGLSSESETSIELSNYISDFVSIIPLPIIITDKNDGIILFTNKLFENLLGAEHGSLLGQNICQFYYYPSDREKILTLLTKRGYIVNHELLIKGNGGTPIKVDLSIQPIRYMGHDSVLSIIKSLDQKAIDISSFQTDLLYRSVVDNIGIGVALISPDMEILAINRQLIEWYPNIKIENKPVCFKEFNTPPGDHVCGDCPVDKSLVDGKLHESEKCVVVNNETIVYRIIASPITDNDGNIVAVIKMMEDITERKRAEELILSSNIRLESLLNMYALVNRSQEELNAAVVEYAIKVTRSKIGYLALVDENESKITLDYCSKSAHELCRVKDKKFVFPLKDVGLWGEAAKQRKPTFTNNYDAPNPLKRGLPDGHVAIKKHLAIPVFDDGAVVAVIGVGNKADDYTDIDVKQLELLSQGWWQIIIRQNNEKKLQASQTTLSKTVSRYSAMINTVPAIMYVKDLEHRYVVVNQSFIKFVKLPEDQILGKTDYDIFPKDKAAIFHAADMEVMKGKHIINNLAESVQDGDGNTRWVSTSKVPVFGENGNIVGVVGLTQDVTDAHKNREQLIQTERLAAIGTLAAGVAHEINNPIGYVNSNLNTMAKYLKRVGLFLDSLPESNRADIKEVLKDFEDAINESIEGTTRVRKIVADLKGFARVDQTNKVLADINEGINSTLNIVWNELKYKAKIEKELGELPDLYCIPNQLNQVFMNILVNAGQAIKAETGLIKIKTWADRSNIFVSIKDNGCGIPEKYLSKIFEPFFTTKEVGKGTGLGLSLSYDIVKKHGGTIDVNSIEGEGSEFVITLPIGGLDA